MSQPTVRQLERNIRRTLAFSFLQVFMVLMPVIVLFFESRGLRLSEVLLLQAWFAALVLVLEVPSGYLADLLGRKRTLVVGTFFGGVGHLVLLYAQGFWQLALFEGCLAVSFSLVSGANLALLYDSELALRASGRHAVGGPSAVSRLFFATNLSQALAAFLCSLLLVWSMEWAMYAQVASAWLAFALTFGLVEPPGERMARENHASNLFSVLRHLLVDDRLLRLTFLALCIWPLTTMFAVWLLQKHWQGQGIEVLWFGCLWGALTLVSAAAGKYALQLEDRLGATTMLLVVGLAPATGYLGLALLGAVGGVLVSALFFACRGARQRRPAPSAQQARAQHIPRHGQLLRELGLPGRVCAGRAGARRRPRCLGDGHGVHHPCLREPRHLRDAAAAAGGGRARHGRNRPRQGTGRVTAAAVGPAAGPVESDRGPLRPLVARFAERFQAPVVVGQGRYEPGGQHHGDDPPGQSRTAGEQHIDEVHHRFHGHHRQHGHAERRAQRRFGSELPP